MLHVSIVGKNNDPYRLNPNRRWNFGFSARIIIRSDLPNEKNFAIQNDISSAFFATILFISLLIGGAIVVGLLTSWCGGQLVVWAGTHTGIMAIAALVIGKAVSVVGGAAVCLLLFQLSLFIGLSAINILGRVVGDVTGWGWNDMSIPYVERGVRKWIYDIFGPLGGLFWDCTYDLEITVSRGLLGLNMPDVAENTMLWSKEYGWN